jgi:SAM-dependent methyltransferase
MLVRAREPVWATSKGLAMDTWRFYAITYRDHVICNPIGLAKLDALIRLLDLPDAPRVLDIGCGKGELLIRLAACFGGGTGRGFRAVGVDRSPYAVAEMRAALAARVPEAEIELLEMDAADHHPEPGAFDLAACLGASWIFDGHRGTLRALRAAVRPGGQVLVGEPFWRTEPDPAYLAWSGMRRDQFGTHAGNVTVGVEEGLVPLLALVSTDDEWDWFETLQWRAAARHTAAQPEDPDLPDLIERVERGRHEYLTWGRATLGWALYMFGVPGPG